MPREWLKTGRKGHRALLVTAETELPRIREQEAAVYRQRLWQTFGEGGGYEDSI
jgi:hypothetical protein